MTKSGTYCKDPCVFLENERLRAAVLPLRGGKTASLFYKPERFELLFQNPKPFYSEARLFDPFGEHEACGFDDAFPTVDACRVRSGGRELSYPDHGEIWSTPLSYEAEGDRVTFSCKCRTVPCRYEKTLSLLEDGVEYAYRITNTGEADFPYLWAFHCLVRYSGGMRLIFPRGVRRVENILDSPSLGPAGTLYRFPGGLTSGGERRDLTAVPAARSGAMEKIRVRGAVVKGRCGYEYPSRNVRAVVEYDAKKLPCLEFWCTAGGYRGDCNCAFEPSTSFCDGADRPGASVLRAGETEEFTVRISLGRIRPGCS